MFCGKCGATVSDGARFCAYCGCEITSNELVRREQQKQANANNAFVPKNGRGMAKRATLIVKNSLIMLLAVIMFAFSFLPIMSIGTEYYGEEVNVNFSAIDNMSMLVASFSNYSSLDETPVYDDIVSLSEYLQEELADLEDVSEKEAVRMFADEISRIAILTAKASLMLEDAKTPVALIFVAILSLLYMMLTVAFFVLSIFNLLGTFGIVKVDARFDWWCNALLSATPVFLLLMFYAMGVSYSATSSMISMSGFVIATVILAGATIVYSTVQRMVFTRNKNIRVLVMRSVVAVLALVIMISSLAPMAYGVVSNKKAAIRAGSFNTYSTLSDEDLEKVNGVCNKEEKKEVESIYKTLSQILGRSLSSTEGESVNNQLILSMVKCWYYPGTIAAFSLIPVAYILVILAAALVMCHCIKYLIHGRESKTPYLIFRIVMSAIAVLALVISIVFTVMMNYAAGGLVGAGYSITIGASSILIAIFAIAIVSMPTFKCRCDIDDDEEIEGDTVTAWDSDSENNNVKNDDANSVTEVVAKIKAFKELYDMGAISEEEFAAKKAQLLEL